VVELALKSNPQYRERERERDPGQMDFLRERQVTVDSRGNSCLQEAWVSLHTHTHPQGIGSRTSKTCGCYSPFHKMA
jgi:hypothetical protein